MIYMVNSIFYKDNTYNFEKGYPSDSFVNYENFNYLPKFENKISCYIFTNQDLFKKNYYFEKYRRFYYFWLKSKNINLKAFNSEYSLKNEQFKYNPLNLSEPIKVKIAKPKKIPYRKDKIDLIQKNNVLDIIIYNPVRANSFVKVSLNDKDHYINCNGNGICITELKLDYGKNILKYKRLSGKLFKKEFINNCKINASNDKVVNIDKNIITFSNYERNPGEKVNINIGKQTFIVTVDKNHQFSIKIPQNLSKEVLTIKQQNCQILKLKLKDIIINIPQSGIQKENLKFTQKDKKIILQDKNKLLELRNGKNSYEFPLPKPTYIKKIIIKEADADNSKINIAIKTESGKIIMLQENIVASGDCGNLTDQILSNSQKGCSYLSGSCCMIHNIDVPPSLKVKSIIINTNDNLKGIWLLKNITLIKDNK